MSLRDEIIDVSRVPEPGDPVCDFADAEHEDISTVVAVIEAGSNTYCGWKVPEFEILLKDVDVEDPGESFVVYSARRKRWEHWTVVEHYDGGHFKND